MTMTRNAKARATREYTATASGEIRKYAASPRQVKVYGRYLPAAYAARFYLSCQRPGRRSVSRERWVEKRLTRRVQWTNVITGHRFCSGPDPLTGHEVIRCLDAR